MNPRHRRNEPFVRLYDGNVGLADPHDDVLDVSAPLLTELPIGTIKMNEYDGLDVIFYGTNAANENFSYEIWNLYRLTSQPNEASHTSDLWLQMRFATADVANLLGAETGIVDKCVTNNELFADTLLATMALSVHGQALQDGLFGTTPGGATPEVITLSNVVADEVAMLHIRHITCDAVRIHLFKPATGDYNDINCMTRRVMTP